MLDRDARSALVARRLGGGVLEQLAAPRALRAVQAEAVVIRGAGALAYTARPIDGHQPGAEHEPAVGDAPSGDGSHEVLRRLAAADCREPAPAAAGSVERRIMTSDLPAVK